VVRLAAVSFVLTEPAPPLWPGHPVKIMDKGSKLIELEALRGIAAIVVLAGHFSLAFVPSFNGLQISDGSFSLFGTPFFAIFNGTAAVVVFFILSGFVLTYGVFLSGDIGRAFLSCLKRWPRLAAAVMIANAISGTVMAFGLYSNEQAALLTHSPWLGVFFNWRSAGYHEIVQAIIEGATTFFSGEWQYNSPLWTMYFEFWGSMLSLGCAILCIKIFHPRVQVFFLLVIWLFVTAYSPYLGTFIIGAIIAMNYSRRNDTVWPGWIAGALIPILIIIFGYHEDMSNRAPGWYAFLNPIMALNPFVFATLAYSSAAALTMLLLLRVEWPKRLLSGRVGTILGFMSFSVYITQIIVILSISSWAYIAFDFLPVPARVLLCGVTTVIGVIVLSVPLAFFDRWWVRTLNRAVIKLRTRYFSRAEVTA
jgi:peptidoglycan/LPS O-acetylase OafA/YrhL